MSFLTNRIIIAVLAVFVLLVLLVGENGENESGVVFSDVGRLEKLAVPASEKETVSKPVSGIETALPEPVETKGDRFYSVVRVIDGDTFSVRVGGVIKTVRLIGLDTPETVHPSKPVECFGKEASLKAKQVLSGEKVRLEQDLSQGKLDKYGRLLVYVYLEDGTNFNKMMIEEGYAFEYTYNIPYKYQVEFKLAEKQARISKRGLWADGVCETEDVLPVVSKTQTKKILPVSANVNCSYNAFNCTDFTTHAKAQAIYIVCGGINNDIHRLDRDKDGLACESLP